MSVETCFVLVHIRWYLVSTIVDMRAGELTAEASSPEFK